MRTIFRAAAHFLAARLALPRRRRAWRALAGGCVLLAGAVFLCDFRISTAARGHLATTTAVVPETPVALVLGTARLHDRRINAFYAARIRAAAELFHAGKVRGILVSGDNGRRDYNEPADMRADLVRAGVPEQCITLDYAGFRTLDSVVRARKVFGQRRLVIVSQRFHVERALYLAGRHGIAATGFIACDPPARASRVKVRVREALARAAAVVDVLTGRNPRFLGTRETVSLRSG